MIISRNRHRRALAVGLTGLVVAAGTAFAASNTVANRNAGAGSGGVSGFTVTDIGYIPTSEPWLIGEVTFNIVRDNSGQWVDSSNAEVLVSLNAGDTYYPCAVSYGTATCEITDPVSFESVETADVVAYDVLAPVGSY